MEINEMSVISDTAHMLHQHTTPTVKLNPLLISNSD